MSQRVKDIAGDPARKIEAIKAYREETGAGLKDAKDAIENWIASPGAAPKAAPDGKWRSQSVPTGAAPWPAPSQPVRDIARDPTGRSKTIRKIEAIKAYREETRAGLKDAKDAVESWLASRRAALIAAAAELPAPGSTQPIELRPCLSCRAIGPRPRRPPSY